VSENSNITFSSVFLDKTPPDDAHIGEMIQWGQQLHASGFITEIESSLSIRTKMGFIITGSNITLDSIKKDGVVEVRGVVFGLNRPSIYVKGQIAPSREALLHSCIYEALPQINAVFLISGHDILAAAEKLGIPSTAIEQPAGSQELAQEAANLVKIHKTVSSFVLKNYGVVILGTTVTEAGTITEEILNKVHSSTKAKSVKKKRI
jgi:ribulose-5-phosphate 4-epimerase/fuculose-1-phosphate aldolase